MSWDPAAAQVHHFSSIGYRHGSTNNCPANKSDMCDCDPEQSNDNQQLAKDKGRCHTQWAAVMRKQPPEESVCTAS